MTCSKKIVLLVLTGLLLVFTGGPTTQAGMIEPGLQQTLDALGPDEEVPVIMILSDQVDVQVFKDLNKSLRRMNLIKALKANAEMTQREIKEFLRQTKVKKMVPLWLINGLAVTATSNVVRELAELPGVERVKVDGTIQAPQLSSSANSPAEWNILNVRAPELWSLGFTGAGIVVASVDTGVDANHPDLSANWRGGANSWFDPNGQHSTPYDKTGHGTQVTGIMVGGSAGGTAIGVAPDATWIAVKIFNDAGQASFSAIHQGFQWLLDPDGNPLTDDAPDVVNNSWGFDQNPGQCITEFEADVQALKAAGIAMVFSAGNAGPWAGTSVSPANCPESFAVGALDSSNNIASFSSRGPSSCDGRIYPDLVAPGVNVKTSDLTFVGTIPNAYAYASGTSFAAPHVSGAMALLLGGVPGLTVEELEWALKDSALDLGAAGPDDAYGYGLLDVMEAYASLQNSAPCVDSDGDGYFAEAGCESVQDCNDGNAKVYPGAMEIKHDGIDQDCNGYDLTINILKATYGARKDTLSVEATSSLGKNANLQLNGYGAMTWDRKKLKWAISVRGVGGDPKTVTVRGVEGWENATTAP